MFGVFGNGSIIRESNEKWGLGSTATGRDVRGPAVDAQRLLEGITGEKQGWKMGQR